MLSRATIRCYVGVLALSLGSGSALSSWAGHATALLIIPYSRAQILMRLPLNAPLSVMHCYPLWCEVMVGGKRGWVARRDVNSAGRCLELVRLGLRNLARTEAAYSAQRDPNGNGRACDESEYRQP